MWHLEWKKSWWNGDVIAWCGHRAKGGEYESDTFYLWRPGPKCQACEDAKKRAGK